jgi:hypothetical protein
LIRTRNSVSPIKHLRLRLDLATRQTRRTLEKRRRSLLTETADSDRLKAANGSDVYLLLRWREDVKRHRALFDSFYDQYDEMIGLLCAAAQLGIEPKMEEEYQRRRAWFMANYPQRVRCLVMPYLTANTSHPTGTDVRTGFWGRRTVDSFEALYLPSSIAALLEADGGNLIERMMHTQEALGAWETHIARQETAIPDTIRFN